MTPVIALLVALACTAAVLAVGARLVVPRPLAPAAARTSPPGTGPLRTALDRAGVDRPAGSVAGTVAGASGLAAAGAVAVTGSPLVGLVCLVAPPVAGVVALRGRIRRRPQRMAAQLPEVLRHVADAVRAGMSLRQALARAADGAPRPVASELAVVAADLAQGARAEDALDAFAERVPHPDVRIAVCAMTVTSRAGGDLPRVLGDLADAVEERGRVAAEIDGATGQARMTAALVAALPAVGAVAVEVAAPGTLVRTLGQGIGRVALLVAVSLMAVAWVLVRRLARVEP